MKKDGGVGVGENMDRGFKKRMKKAKVNKEKRIKYILCGEKKRGNWWRSGTEGRRGDKEEDRPSSLYPVGRDLGGEPPSYSHTGKSVCAFSPRCMCARACVRLRSTEKRDLYFGTLIS